MGGFNTIIPKVTPAEVEIPLNKVKLPTPLESDYVTPIDVQVSSTSMDSIDISTKELRINETLGVTNKDYIYDNDPATYARPTSTVPANSTVEMMVWDLGSVKRWHIEYKIGSATGYAISRLYYSIDDVDYVLIDSAQGEAKEGSVDVECRYIKWEVRNIASSSVFGSYFRIYTLNVSIDIKNYLFDEDEVTGWQPDPINEVGAYAVFDMGALKICGGCRIYWDTANRPSSYVIEVSDDGSTWTEVYNSNGETPSAGWVEYSWNARYCRYIRYRNTHSTGENQQMNEFDYYSRIVERVASEHGHGSRVTPHLKGHGVRRGFTYQEKINNLLKRNPRLKDLVDYLEFMLNE